MAIEAIQKLMTADELMALGADARVEIIDGELIEMSPVGGTHVFVVDNLYDILKPIVKKYKLGYLFTDGLIYPMHKEEPGLKGAFVPDLSFIRKENIDPNWNPDDPYPGIPDFAVEVISPGDSAELVSLKIRRYLEYGTEQVWVIYPSSKEVYQHWRDQPDTVKVHQVGSAIDASAFFRDTEIVTKALFALPELD